MKGINGRWGLVVRHDGRAARLWVEFDANGMPFVIVGGCRYTIEPGESCEWLLI